MLEPLSIVLAASLTVYPSIQRVSDGLWFDWSDSTFKASGSVTQPGPGDVVARTIAGSAFSHYSSSVELSRLNKKATAADYSVFWREKVGGSESLAADTIMSHPGNPPLSVRLADLASRELRFDVQPGFDPEAGPGDDKAYLLVSVLHDSALVPIATLDNTATLAATVREQGASVDTLTISAQTVKANHTFSLTHETPGLLDNRNYLVTLTLTCGGVTAVRTVQFATAG